MQLTPHLSFDGQCEQAFQAYQRILGGNLNLLRYGDTPMAADIEPRWHGRILHATLQTDGFELAGADTLPDDYRRPQGFAVIINIPDLDRAGKVFAQLAEGGTVHVPFAAVFWSPGYGMCTDCFGTPWEINCNATPADQE